MGRNRVDVRYGGSLNSRVYVGVCRQERGHVRRPHLNRTAREQRLKRPKPLKHPAYRFQLKMLHSPLASISMRPDQNDVLADTHSMCSFGRFSWAAST